MLSAMASVIHQDAWATIRLDDALGLLRYERSSVPYATVDEVERAYAAAGEALGHVRPGLKLLIDMRQAPPRNDDEFETRAGAALGVLLGRFPRYATLVRTAVGKLQTARIAAERGVVAHVFEDERDALAYLAGR